eukprot:CAMPEP_0183595964 /NCGR_PEP_ID=MMETSP0371-20130417/174313_1 /TAXON_ID=268820 /ORGANISM="Peridinium aciculiferum, Strain PAER-2" /LENGTH=87 /DNA_ID=CAMNT_0025807795 /DNA_START=115 /DNA_END=375 /DNA_ORIENTATION=-
MRAVSALSSRTPEPVATFGLLLLPPSLAAYCARCCRGRAEGAAFGQAVLGALLGGALLGLLASTPPRLYGYDVADQDIHSTSGAKAV